MLRLMRAPAARENGVAELRLLSRPSSAATMTNHPSGLAAPIAISQAVERGRGAFEARFSRG
jgi:hypothetical protein